MSLESPLRAIWRALPILGRRWLVVVALGLSACSSLPTINPDLQRPRGEPVLVSGPAGPMSADQSRQWLARLQAQAPVPTTLLERHLAFEQAFVERPLWRGNQVRLLVDGPETYRSMFAEIQGAQQHIHLETYIFEDDEVGNAFADLLIERQRAGVQVSVIYDSVGTLGTPAAFFQRLREEGIRTVEFNPVNPLTAKAGWDVNSRDHRKLLIVDGRVAFLGGVNISSVYSGGSFSQGSRLKEAAPATRDRMPWRDTHLLIAGPVVADFQRLFLDTWHRQKGEPLPERGFFPDLPPVGPEVVRAIGSSPQDAYSHIYVTLMSAIQHAESEILLTNAYFVPDPQLLTALKAAVARGVSVKLLLPSKTDSSLVFHAGRASYTQLLKSGVRIFERRGALLHSKTALIDGVWSTVGSTNLDWRSFLHNMEVNAVVLGASFGNELRALFEQDLAESQEITLQAWRKRGLGPRLRETFSRVWEYWL